MALLVAQGGLEGPGACSPRPQAFSHTSSKPAARRPGLPAAITCHLSHGRGLFRTAPALHPSHQHAPKLAPEFWERRRSWETDYMLSPADECMVVRQACWQPEHSWELVSLSITLCFEGPCMQTCMYAASMHAFLCMQLAGQWHNRAEIKLSFHLRLSLNVKARQ